ncbi:peptidylprolyl isomerase [Methylovirgula sp. HY1]|uniref:peptidylprolyl isomerase n=1 Tax=Methylovirgula sp. HY1 TaxID=2822761 RepID=UPI001C5BF2BC|nr:peptidylprolyl isomerase [Methylovirgula sp. HY1]QXX75827.1 putative parvulin-type peptidyl-prolyl cis-trans isomerase [Methylovirgula sp. HY1]
MSMMKSLHASAFGLAFALSSAVPAVLSVAPAHAAVLAKVNGQVITDEDLKLAAQDLGQNIPQQLQGKARDAYILDYLIDGDLVAQKAEAEKLDQTPDFPKKVAYYRQKLLMEALLSKVAKQAETEEAMKKVYDAAAKAQKPEMEIHARHILVATKAEAEAALKRIKAGEDFAKVAKEVSKDPGADGGDLGWFTKERMVPAFAAAAFKLKPGQVSEPVQTQFGWHIIKVEGERETKFPPFDKVKDQLERYVVQKAQAQLISELRKGAKVERFDTPATPATPAKPDASKPATPAPATKK